MTGRKIVIAPDSFKGTMTSPEICSIIAGAFTRKAKEYIIETIPIADGGEGTVDCFIAGGYESVNVKIHSPFFEAIDARYAVNTKDGKKTAVIESAQAVGLNLVKGRENPAETTSYGIGEMILDAAKNGCEEIVLALGGTCTNDMGAGMLAALGMKFFDSDKRSFVPVGKTLCDIAYFDDKELKANLGGVRIRAMCDVTNPLFGEKGAAYVFAPQKGADEAMVKSLDLGLINFADVIKAQAGRDVSDVKGAGAAGGIGAAVAFLGGKLNSGIDEVLTLTDFKSKAEDALFVITGEGRADSQSLDGKAISGVCRASKELDVPVIVIAGDVCDVEDELYEMGACSVFSINRRAVDFAEAKKTCREDLKRTAEAVAGLCDILSK